MVVDNQAEVILGIAALDQEIARNTQERQALDERRNALYSQLGVTVDGTEAIDVAVHGTLAKAAPADLGAEAVGEG